MGVRTQEGLSNTTKWNSPFLDWTEWNEYKPKVSYLSEGLWRWAWRNTWETWTPHRWRLFGSLGLLRFSVGLLLVEA